MALRVVTRCAVCTALFGLRFLASEQEPLLHRIGAALPPGMALVSPPSPFAADCNAAQTGTNFHNGAVEPFVVADPTNPDHIVGAWQQDRWADGGSSGLVSAVSMDRGKTWAPSFAHFSTCSGGTGYNRASDPWVAISPGGAAYQISLSLIGANNITAIQVSRSPDGGFTWGDPATLITDTLATGFNDKESIAADPNDAHYVYAVWDRSAGNSTPAWFARTANGGASWEAAHSIYNPGNNASASALEVIVLPDGTVANVFVLSRGNSPAIAIIRSQDHGVTWSAPVVVSTDEAANVVNPKTQALLRTGAGVPSAAVDPATGAIYAVWGDSRFNGGQRDGVAFSKSLDRGQTWSAPIQINQVKNGQAFLPAVAAGAGGVAVTYFDFRKDTPDVNTLLTNCWRVISTDGGNSWTESPVFGPFDFNSAPLTTSGKFIGDYQGLAAAGSDFLSFFAAANSGSAGNPSSIFATSTAQRGDMRGNGRVEINHHPRPYQPKSHPEPGGGLAAGPKHR